MEALLGRYRWAIDLVVIAGCALLLGQAAGGAVEAGLVIPATPAPAARRMAIVHDKGTDEIVRRNIFCSACPLVAAAPRALDERARVLTLLAVMYAAPPYRIESSLAIIRDSERIGAFGVGERLGSLTITEIRQTRVHLDNGELLDLFRSQTLPPAREGPSAELDRGLRRIGEHAYEIRRETLEAMLGNTSLLAREARIVPEMRDGRGAGFRFEQVRAGGPFSRIGLQGGDIICSINGLEMTGPEKALEAYAKLRSASHFSVGVERNGRRLSKEYSIR